MKYKRGEILGAMAALLAAGLFYSGRLHGQAALPEKMTMPPNRKAHVLVVAETKGFQHDSVPDAMASVYRMGHDTGLWEATLRTDTENITKAKKGTLRTWIISMFWCSPARPPS